MARLAMGEVSVKELSTPFAMSAPAITKHLKVLEHAGLTARSREAQWRPCRLAPKPLKHVDELLAQLQKKDRKSHVNKKR